MKQYLVLFLSVLILVGCSSEVDDTDIIDGEDDTSVEGFEDAAADFTKTEFEDPAHVKILEELDVCLMIDQDSTVFATCSPENFRIMPFKNGVDVKDAFILQMKAGIVLKGQAAPLPERNVLIFERDAGQLVKVNGFRGDLTATRGGTNGAKDLVVTFYSKEEETFFDCIFKWSGTTYDFKFVEGVNWGEGFKPIKESMMDSVSKDIYTDLMQNSKIF